MIILENIIGRSGPESKYSCMSQRDALSTESTRSMDTCPRFSASSTFPREHWSRSERPARGADPARHLFMLYKYKFMFMCTHLPSQRASAFPPNLRGATAGPRNLAASLLPHEICEIASRNSCTSTYAIMPVTTSDASSSTP